MAGLAELREGARQLRVAAATAGRTSERAMLDAALRKDDQAALVRALLAAEAYAYLDERADDVEQIDELIPMPLGTFHFTMLHDLLAALVELGLPRSSIEISGTFYDRPALLEVSPAEGEISAGLAKALGNGEPAFVAAWFKVVLAGTNASYRAVPRLF